MGTLSSYSPKIEMAFGGTPVGYPPLNVNLWVDITADVSSVEIIRGRDSALSVYDTGTAEIVLRNEDAKYDPLNSAGTHYGDLLPLVPVRITMNDSTSTRQYMFSGFVAPRGGWKINYEMPRASTVTVSCVDWLAILSQQKLRTVTAPSSPEALAEGGHTFANAAFGEAWNAIFQNKSMASAFRSTFDTGDKGARSGTFLNDLGALGVWPVPESWSYDVGQTFVQGYFGTGDTDALSYMQTVAESEGGALYVTKSGQLRYDGRLAPLTVTRQTTSQVTFGDSGSDVRYTDLQFDYASDIYNRATVTPETYSSPLFTPQTYDDTTSQSYYMISEQSIDGGLMDSIPEAQARAEQLVLGYKDPVETPSLISLAPLRANSVRDAALKRELRDRITIKFKPPGVGSQRTTDAYVESIHHTFDAEHFTTTLGLSSVARFGFTDPSIYIKLDGTTPLDGTKTWAV